MSKKLLLMTGLMIIASTWSFSQVPVFVPVQNISQQNPGWCWAAVSEQIIKWKKHRSPKQCELVSEFKKEVNDDCCATPSICNKPGSLQQVQGLLNQFGITYSDMLPLPNARSLYSILEDNHVVVVFVQSSSVVGHCIVIMGIESGNDWTTVYVNDPTGTYEQAMPMTKLLSLWSVAIAI